MMLSQSRLNIEQS